MKYIFIFTLLMPFSSFAQPKNATKIFVKTAATIDTIEMMLFERGYTIDNINRSLGIVITKPRELKGAQGTVIARILLKDSVATITGECSLNMEFNLSPVTSKNTFLPVKNIGSKISTMRHSWAALHNIAIRLGSELSYE